MKERREGLAAISVDNAVKAERVVDVMEVFPGSERVWLVVKSVMLVW
jgi:hypothetical protein